MKPTNWIAALNARVSAFKSETEAQGKTFYQGASRIDLASFPPKEHWDDWIALEPVPGTGKRRERHYMLVPTTCFNCESACGLLAYIDKESLEVRKFEGNPEHAGSRGRNCAKGPATINQITDPDRILYPLKRAGARGEGKWQRVTWDEVLDTLAERIRNALREKRHGEIMYHYGRAGEDGFAEDILKIWGVDGINSHTNICSSSARSAMQYWMGYDRPSNDFANAEVIVLTSAHLEAGHYFNPHAQRIMEAKKRGARLIVVDVRMSNTATHADHWISPYPGTEPAIFLAIARHLIETRQYNREFVRRWWNWHEYLTAERPDLPDNFESFETVLAELYADYTFEYAAAESQVPVAQIKAVAETVAVSGTRLCTQNWRSAAAGNLGGWQIPRTMFLLNALMGAIGVKGSTYPNGWNKFVGKRPVNASHPEHWNELTYPREYPLTVNEMSFMLPHLVKEGRGRIDTYFTRVYNPVWTNPGGFDWVEMLSDDNMIGMHAALTPTWNETAYFADFVLPMGHSSERHDLFSSETHNSQWVAFRQPVQRAARERLGETITDTREVNPGEVWEEDEFWLELTWRIDPDGSMGIRQHVESMANPGERMSLDEYFAWIFDNSIPGLPDKAAAEGLTALAYMRRYGNFEIDSAGGDALYDKPLAQAEIEDESIDAHGRVYTRAAAPPKINHAPAPDPEPDADGRRAAGVQIDGEMVRGFPTPSGKLEFYSSTLVQWGWPEAALPTYIKSHVHRDKLAADQMPLIPTFRLPTQIHTRGANAKWLSELAHNNPVWMHPKDAGRLGVADGQRIRVETELGYFVAEAWVTQGIRPGVLACSHHMGRWQFTGGTGDGHQRTMETTLSNQDKTWSLTPAENKQPLAPRAGSDAKRVWWTAVGVHQNLTYGVHPDPITGQQCWHQAVRVRPAEPEDVPGQIHVDLEKSNAVYREWLAMARPADQFSPDGSRRPRWMIRPLKPSLEASRLPGRAANSS